MDQEIRVFKLQLSTDQMLARAREMTGIDIIDESA